MIIATNMTIETIATIVILSAALSGMFILARAVVIWLLYRRWNIDLVIIGLAAVIGVLVAFFS